MTASKLPLCTSLRLGCEGFHGEGVHAFYFASKEVMARAKSFFDDVKKEIECPVCQEQFGANKQPKILKCLHTFCKSCLDGWLRQHRTGALSCPTCRTVTECPNSDIDSLPSNLFYKQMVEIVEAYTGQEESSFCGKCDEQNSLRFYCSNCNCLLCEECAIVHKKWKDFRNLKFFMRFKRKERYSYNY